ncbi:MAG: hypothetical protein MUF84_02265 [Anaerolineae bacterium]|jgi:hypothetical protein|nr:hypothetical protein [Anaerolineae bacterium]
MQPRRVFVLLPMMVLIGLALAGCNAEKQAPTELTPPPTTACTPEAACPEPIICPEPPECPSSVSAPFEGQWLSSPHADAAAEAFVHWNEDDPAVVPEDCARCHSTYGYQDYLGADGSPAGVVDQAAAIGSVITCVACHNDATVILTNVVFPSGLEVTGLGDEARCMQCHQGRAAGATVDAAIEAAALSDMDVSSADLRFTNIHYFAASATQYGTWAMGGYEYANQAYDVKFDHAGGLDTCIDCHQPHTLEIRIDRCSECHEGVTTVDALKNVRTMGSQVDYDGDGDTEEGVYYEIEGLQAMLTEAMQAYSKEVTGNAIAYSPDAYPYFLTDTNANGAVDEAEASRDNGYASFTGRLAKAAYNLHLSVKDPGAFAHGGKYIIELLYDSITDLNSVLTSPVDLSSAHRIDAGHFASSEYAFRYFDGAGEVRAGCARCHSTTGLPTYLKDGVTVSAAPAAGLACTTCHDPASEDFAPRVVTTVRFPSGAVLDSGNPNSNVCMSCHQGRESGPSVDRVIAGLGDDDAMTDQPFVNVHYFAAGATLLGGDAHGGYEYAGQEYAGQREHVEGAETCVDCHNVHGLAVDTERCRTCHKTEDVETIRMSEADFDGDGDTEEGLAEEIATMEEAVYAAMLDYAATALGAPIVYGDDSPYFFKDLNANGLVDADEIDRANAYTGWTPRLLRAAYNYQYVHKDPGAFAHNGEYVLQLLYDTLASVGDQNTVDMTAMVRP